MRSKLLAILLSLAMVVSLTPAIAFAGNESEAAQDQTVQSEETGTDEFVPEEGMTEREIHAMADNWAAFKVTLSLSAKVKIGQTATYNLTIKNTTNKALTISWINSLYYKTSNATGYEFGKIYSGGNAIANDGKGIKFSAGQSRSYTVKGTVPKSWINGKSHITIVVADNNAKCYGQADAFSTFSAAANPTPTPTPTPTVKATSTGYRFYSSKAKYVAQSSLSRITGVGSMIRNNMEESKSKPIPGLANTNIGKEVGTYVPQGFCKFTYSGKTYYLITAYDSRDGSAKQQSVLYVLDSSMNFVKNLTLPNKYHNGGIAYDSAGKVVWFTGNTGSSKTCDSVMSLSGSTLYSLITASGKTGSIRGFTRTCVINNVASCLDYYNGRLWVGTCGGLTGKIVGYKTSGTTLYTSNTITVAGVGPKLNGFTFGTNSDIYLSYSSGRNWWDTSKVVHSKYVAGSLLGSSMLMSVSTESEVPRMNEELVLNGSYLYVMYESAATAYYSNAYIVTDRITAINSKVWSSVILGLSTRDTAALSSGQVPILEGENVTVDFAYNEAEEINTKESVFSFTPETTGDYKINVELTDKEQGYYVSGGILDAESEGDPVVIGELSTVRNKYNDIIEPDEEGGEGETGETGAEEKAAVEAEYLDTAEMTVSLEANHEYNLCMYASASGEIEDNADYASSYEVAISNTGERTSVTTTEGDGFIEEVTAGSTSCFEVTPGETGTYLIDWQSENNLSGCRVTDYAGNPVEINDNYCELTAGKTYFFKSTPLEGNEENTAEVSFRYKKMDESQLEDYEDVAVTDNTVLTYHAANNGRQLVVLNTDSDESGETSGEEQAEALSNKALSVVALSDDSDEDLDDEASGVRISAYDSQDELVGIGNDLMVFETEEGSDYRITCTGVTAADNATLFVCPYVANIDTVDITMDTKLTYKKDLEAPVPTVFEDQVELVEGVDYTVENDGAPTIGKHSVTVTGIGENYTGSRVINYTVSPAKTTIRTPKRGSKRVTVKWKTTAGGVKYQIGYKLSGKSWKYAYAGISATSKTIKKLKSKKNYYVKVRAYKSVGGKKYYGAWSASKKVKIK